MSEVPLQTRIPNLRTLVLKREIQNPTPYTPATKLYTLAPFVMADSEREPGPGAQVCGDLQIESILQYM